LICSVIAQISTLPSIWKTIDFSIVWPFLIGGLIGVPLGTMLIAHADPRVFKLTVGVFLAGELARRLSAAAAAIALTAAAAVSASQFEDPARFAFDHTVRIDAFGQGARMLIFVSGLLAVCVAFGMRDLRERGVEYHALLLSACAGMSLLSVANSFVTTFVALELFSICLYVLVAIETDDLLSLEGGLKYLIIGSIGAAFLLYGTALVYGATGQLEFDRISTALSTGDAHGVLLGELFAQRLGMQTGAAGAVSDYTGQDIYYRSIQHADGVKDDRLTIHDYLWRWDTDWFWCSKNLFVQNPIVRRLVGRKRLNSTTYAKVMRWNSKWGFTRAAARLSGKTPESVIQDVDIPVARAPEFLAFFLKEIGVLPVWICPIGGYDTQERFPLYAIDPQTLYVNFGFWDVVQDKVKREPGHYNRKIERKVAELGGIKSLYSDSYYPEEEFWRLYNQSAYGALKARYDPQKVFRNLYEKCVLRR